MFTGVSKSGSPAPKPMTLSPSARICFAMASMARVVEGFTFFASLESSFISTYLPKKIYYIIIPLPSPCNHKWR